MQGPDRIDNTTIPTVVNFDKDKLLRTYLYFFFLGPKTMTI